MLVTDKAKTLRLVAKNFLNGKIHTKDFLNDEDAYGWAEPINTFKHDLMVWLAQDSKDVLDEAQKMATDKLFSKFMGFRMKGVFLGEITDVDTDEENMRLKKLLEEKTNEAEDWKRKAWILQGRLEEYQKMYGVSDTVTSEVKDDESSGV